MKSFYTFVTVCIVALLLSSCANIEKHKKESLVDTLENLVQRVENNGSSYSDEQWEKVAEKYDELIVQIDETDYSDEQLKRIGKLKMRFYTAQYEYEMECGMKSVRRVMKELEGALE